METYQEDLVYERKLDWISGQIEELMLDSMIAALKKIKDRNLFCSDIKSRSQDDPYPF